MSQPLKLTTRGRYAVKAMVELAKATENETLPLSKIAEEAGISLSYLEQLIAGLRRHDLVKSFRGPGGGYIIARDLSEIKISDILLAAEDSTPAKRANQNEYRVQNCEHTYELWSEIGSLLHITLQTISLKDVLDRKISNHPTTSKLSEILG